MWASGLSASGGRPADWAAQVVAERAGSRVGRVEGWQILVAQGERVPINNNSQHRDITAYYNLM